jgi:LysM repeat protein
MYIRLSVIILFISYSLNSFANSDSIGVENNKGKKLIVHKIEPKETYYSLARKYDVTPSSVIEFNSNIALQPGKIVKVPTERPFIEENAPTSTITVSATYSIIDYKVGPKETLYFIAKRFNTTIEDIRQLNNIQGSALSIGQTLKVRQGTLATPVPPAVAATAPELSLANKEEFEPVKTEAKVPSNRYGLRAISDRGAAIAIEDENIDGTKLLVLHRTAPTGTVMKITNPMTQKSTFAKVVGKFTENESTKDVIIIVTKATSELLGALDKRFQVYIDYGITE